MSEKTIEIKGLKTFLRDRGKGDPVLILHGWDSNADTWQKTQDELVKNGFRVITIDLPGFWRTEEPKEIWHLKDYSDFAHEIVRYLDLGQFTLLGHSFGGRIAIDYALRYSKELSALVLVSAAGVVKHKKAKIGFLLLLTKIGNAIFYLPILSLLKPLAEKVWYKFIGEHDYQKASSTMKNIMKVILEEELQPYLPQIKTPTLILWGDLDTATPLSDAYMLHKSIPVSRLHIFPDMPHALNLKAPIGIATEVVRFLKSYSKK